ncbi:MAG TPA: class I SAM-dependent methyltransferase [Rhodothermales bacterium]|nr:hypothetical protein [Bacteroidota bacterium]HRK73975.1 class I SAM-dependent methyltransferase [Rhodothermales bacterium]HRR07160.1 class I SAM-dependent methyltransferase [Rhodothermales bacterium]
MANPHLLRTLAAVPPDIPVLDLSPDQRSLYVPLVQLGFRVTCIRNKPLTVAEPTSITWISMTPEGVLPISAQTFEWVIAHRSFDLLRTEAQCRSWVNECHRVLRDGGWMYLCVPAIGPEQPVQNGRLNPLAFTAVGLQLYFSGGGWAVAEQPYEYMEEERLFWCAIFRKVGPNTIA